MRKLFTKLKTSDGYVLALLIAFALVARIYSFFPITIDHDESTYAVIADHILKGSHLYRDVIDIKQPGIFLIFIAIQWLFGKSIILIRLSAALAVAVGSFFVYKLKRANGEFEEAIISAILYICMFNFFFAFSANTEVFFVGLVAVGIYYFYISKKWWYYLLSGSLFGMAFIVKQLALFDFFAVLSFLLITQLLRGNVSSFLTRLILLGIAFIAPFGLCHLYFWTIGDFEYYRFITYDAPFNYATPRSWNEFVSFNWRYLSFYFPFVLLALLGWRSGTIPPRLQNFILILLVMDFLAMNATGKKFSHYFTQMVIPLSLLAGNFILLPVIGKWKQKRLIRIASALSIGIYIVVLIGVYHYKYVIKPNKTAELYAFLLPIVKEDHTLYAGNAPQILYWLFDKESPTPYIHRSLMMNGEHIQTLEIDVESQLEHIYAHGPTVIVLSAPFPYAKFRDRIGATHKKIGDVSKHEIWILD